MMNQIILVTALLFSAGLVHAEPNKAAPKEGTKVEDQDEKLPKDHPCHRVRQQLMQACETAGFKKGDHKEKKGLFMDCVHPLMSGQEVPGVTIDKTSKDFQECQAKREAHHNKHEHK